MGATTGENGMDETATTEGRGDGSSVDVVIIGGGAAGLSAATALGRARRTVVVVDAGDPRNAPADAVHNLLTRDGTPPAELLRLGREEAAGYGVRIVDGRVVSARGAVEEGFTVTTDSGRELRARRILVATGLRDVLPEIEGLQEHWGHGVLHCPYCHGWEVRDARIAILGTGPAALHQASLFRQWSADVTLVVHADAAAPDAEARERFAARGIGIVEERVLRVVATDGALSGLELESGRVLDASAVVVAPRGVVREDGLEGLGLTVEEHPRGMGTQFVADAMGATPVPGVSVAGNAADVGAQVVTSAAAGLLAGAAINADLIVEEERVAVAAARSVAA